MRAPIRSTAPGHPRAIPEMEIRDAAKSSLSGFSLRRLLLLLEDLNRETLHAARSRESVASPSSESARVFVQNRRIPRTVVSRSPFANDRTTVERPLGRPAFSFNNH